MHFKKRSAFIAVVVSCALIAAFASPGLADSKSDLKKKKHSVTGKIGGAQKDYDQSSKKYAAAAAALNKAQKSLDAAKNHLGETRGHLAAAKAKDAQMAAALNKSEAELATAKSELAAGQQSLQDSETRVENFTVESLQEGDRGLRAFGELLRGASPTSFSEHMSLNSSVSDAQLATMQQLAAKKVLLGLKRDKVKKLRDEVAAKRKEAAASLKEQKSLEKQAEAQTAKVTELVGARASAEKKANDIRSEDLSRLKALESERNSLNGRLRVLAQKELAAARRAAAKKQSSGGHSSSSGGSGGGSYNGGSGTLSYPARGPITSPYGMRFHPTRHVYKLHDGTDFGVPCGTPVHAAASGKIVQEYFNVAYGNRIILSNGIMRGKSVVTTYNHLSRFVARAGQRVKRGQLIGYSGTTGWSTGCHLHFMVIANGGTTNPMGWL